MLFSKKKPEPEPQAPVTEVPEVKEPEEKAPEKILPLRMTTIGRGITFYGNFETEDPMEINGSVMEIQHIAGMQDSKIIISINSDPDAPINQIADYVITGSVEEVIPKLIKYYKKNSK